MLSSMREKTMRTTPPSDILAKGYGGLGQAVLGGGVGLLVDCLRAR